MIERILPTLRFAAAVLLAASLTTTSQAQTAAAPKTKTDAKKAAAASESDPDVALARKAALEWLALVDSFKFEGTWDTAATSFQKAQAKTEWAKGLGGARTAMGKVVTRTVSSQEVRKDLPNLPPGKYITVRYNTVFEKHKDGTESITLVKDGARGFRMMSYLLR